ncbi:peptidyl-prolyl cis-trans isomerase [Leptolyngbya sp. Heron Island J]|uniref:peptidylprolyl isomerase n=1 Tax=Leptolyngbya sp. Heron Island J TaxID=1385935 RepID=UPI0003B9F223|nr:peptidylprolyl isomerase [Leptolyngbya sp. Heron Island J]ESA32226.1 peptidyl-prolyl cis-trans isomerase [Leptolyngbya sp. Heron Island J]
MSAVLKIGDSELDIRTLLERLQQHQLLPRLVQEIVVDQAIASINCDLEEAYKTFCHQRNLVTEQQQQAWQAQNKLTQDQMYMMALREAKIAKFKQETWGHQIESYFLERKVSLDRVLYSLIRTKDPSLAQELYFRLNDDGESFADLARRYSEGQEAQTGGLIGPVELSVPHPMIGRMLSVSQPGQLWSPTPIGEWYVITRLEKFVPAQFDESMRQRLMDELFKTWLKETTQATAVQPLVS